MAKKIKMKDRLVFFNGKFVQEKNAKLSIYDFSQCLVIWFLK